MTLTEELSQYIVQLTYDDLPKEVIEFTKVCILDWYGSAIAGMDEPPVMALKEILLEMGGNEQVTLISGEKTSIANAAMIHGAASHVVELDDIHKASVIHAATVVIPAALAVCEAYDLSGEALITGIVAGYEICYRIGEAVTPSHYHYWHNTATCGTFGSAAAAAKVLGLNEKQTMHALGNAGTQAAGLWEFIEDGANSKQLHTAKAAYNGVLAAQLAKKGFTGAAKILEGNRGFFKAMSKTYNEDKIVERLGEQYKIMENGFKLFASCRHTHPSMDCVQQLMHDHEIQPTEIKKILIETYQTVLDITDNAHPHSIYAAKFSIQFCVSLLMQKGRATLKDFNQDTLHDSAIRALMKEVHVVSTKELNEAYPEKWGAKVTIILKDDTSYRMATDFPRGDPENPANQDELIEKFQSLVSGKIVDANNKVNALFHIENLQVSEWLPVKKSMPKGNEALS